MKYEQWEKILSAVDKKEGLSKDNIIERIQKELEVYPGEHEKWKKVGFKEGAESSVEKVDTVVINFH